MLKPSPQAGGFFLTFCILTGFIVGTILGQAMTGVLAGTFVGAAAAVLLWLLDRRRGA